MMSKHKRGKVVHQDKNERLQNHQNKQIPTQICKTLQIHQRKQPR